MRDILRSAVWALALLGCVERSATPRSNARDDLGTPISVRAGGPPRRIVSLGPATTDLLFALHAGPRLVGRSQWDLYPDSARFVADLGPALRPNVEMVLARRPDLVVLYASEDNRPAIRRFQDAGIATVALRVDRIADFRRAARLLADIVGNPKSGEEVVDSVTATLERVRSATRSARRPTVFWQIWDAPLITIGSGSFLTELVDIAGGRNIYDDLPHPSPQVSFEDVVRRDPEVILAGPERTSKMRSEPAWRAVSAVRNGRVLVVDTTLVGRPSIRLGEAAVHLAKLLHPEIQP